MTAMSSSLPCDVPIEIGVTYDHDGWACAWPTKRSFASREQAFEYLASRQLQDEISVGREIGLPWACWKPIRTSQRRSVDQLRVGDWFMHAGSWHCVLAVQTASVPLGDFEVHTQIEEFLIDGSRPVEVAC